MSDQLVIQPPRRDGGVAVLSFKPYTGGGVLRGWCDVHVIPWRFRIIGCPASSNGERRWVGLPGKPMTDRDGQPLRDDKGKVRYSTFASFDDVAILRRFSDSACQALDVYLPGWDQA